MGSISLFKKNTDEKANASTAGSKCNLSGRIHMIPVERICPNPAQPRKSFEDETIIRLADSIRQYGILQPLSVRCLALNGQETQLVSKGNQEVSIISGQSLYEIIAGERRLRAAKLLGMKDVPCIIINVDSQKSAELAIIENIQREDLNIFEQAGAIASLIDIYGLTQEQIARLLSTSQSYVANKLRILRLTTTERNLILEHGLTERHARALLKLSSVDARIETIKHIIARGMNVSQTEFYIDRMISGENEPQIKGKRRLILKDIRIFYNTIERAIDTIERAGVDVTSEKKDYEDTIELIIKVKKKYENDTVA